MGLCSQDGRVKLNPPTDTRIAAGDRIVAISEDDDTVRLSGLADIGIDESAIREGQPRPRQPGRTLILGWNQRAPMIIGQMDSYAAPGSEVTVVADVAPAEAEEAARRCGEPANQRVTFRQGDTTDRPGGGARQPSATGCGPRPAMPARPTASG